MTLYSLSGTLKLRKLHQDSELTNTKTRRSSLLEFQLAADLEHLPGEFVRWGKAPGAEEN